MKEQYPEKSYKLFALWLLFFTVMAVALSLRPELLPGMNAGCSIGLMIFIGLDILFLIIYATESVYWISGTSYEMARKAGKKARKKYAAWHLFIFLGGTVCFFLYVFLLKLVIRTNVTVDAMTACVMICIAALLTIPLKLSGE